MSATESPLNVCTIEPGAPFLRVLADALYDGALKRVPEKLFDFSDKNTRQTKEIEHSRDWAKSEPALLGAPFDRSDPLALARCTILLPTRRACRLLRDILSERSSSPVLLPRIRALGDADAAELALDADSAPDFPDPRGVMEPGAPVIGALERQLILTQLIQRWGEVNAAQVMALGPGEAPVIPGSPAHAARLAADLARLMDQVETEGLDFSMLERIVPEDHAGYWQITLSFLRIVTRQWPSLLEARASQSAATQRNAMIDAQADRLRRMAAAGHLGDPIIAAGSTGSIPATARLLRVIAGLPRGAVVLPGFDSAMDDATFAALEGEANASHPQHGMTRLVRGFGLRPGDVRRIGPTAMAQAAARAALARDAMRPVALTGHLPDRIGGEGADAVWRGLTYLEAGNVQEEAAAIALMMRETLTHPGRTMALVTPDRALARRVQAELRRWDIRLDDSAGVPLAQTPPGIFMRLVAGVARDGLTPVALLSVLKHPLCRLGLAPEDMRRRARLLERLALRGPRPQPNFAGLRAGIRAAAADEDDRDHCFDLIDRLEAALGAFCACAAQRSADLGALTQAHREAATRLAMSDSGDSNALWSGEAGEALERHISAILNAAASGWAIAGADYAGLFTALLSGMPIRARAPGHARLHILGPLEARLVDVDCIVLGGLNEGLWPAEPARDPWLNRAMRAALGLPAPERRIGLAAHDFVQGFTAPQVVLTRAARQGGAQTVPSRFILRLDAALKGGGMDGLIDNAASWRGLTRHLLQARDWTPAQPPQPRPVVDARPKSIYVTQVEQWIRDPYAFYARHILGLRPLDPLDAAPDAASRGTLIHEIVARFMTAQPDFAQPDAALVTLTAIGRDAFSALPDAPEIKAFWWRRFARAAAWFVSYECERAPLRRASFSEIEGAMSVPGVDLEIRARADRIDRLADGALAIIDYKTGASPTGKEILAGFAPQLPLEAAIAQAGGFAAREGALRGDIAMLAFLRITGATPPGEEARIKAATPAELAAAALAGLGDLAGKFERPEQPYYSRTRPRFEAEFDGDYDHLARAREWARQPDGGQ